MADPSRGVRNNTRVRPREKRQPGGSDNQFAGVVRQLQQQVAQIQRDLQNARGEGGIEVKWPVISLDDRQLKAGAGNNASATVPIDIYCVFNGGKTLIRLNNATVVT